MVPPRWTLPPCVWDTVLHPPTGLGPTCLMSLALWGPCPTTLPTRPAALRAQPNPLKKPRVPGQPQRHWAVCSPEPAPLARCLEQPLCGPSRACRVACSVPVGMCVPLTSGRALQQATDTIWRPSASGGGLQHCPSTPTRPDRQPDQAA